jgi:hypothetical protein
MSKRKHVRRLLRAEAETKGAKPSAYVHTEFDRMQVRKYGRTRRRINQATSTHRKAKWRFRIEAVM